MDIYQDNSCVDLLVKALYDENVGPVDLPFFILKAITAGFDDKQLIGRGGFGAVYKGALQNNVLVAVKKLYDMIEILEENFQHEVACLVEVKHKNIVRFLGYCSETQHVRELYEGTYVWANVRQRLFCFEYLKKGSLAKYITEPSSGLQWRVRYQIIKGICEGVRYLHQKSIIHMDLKPENILLDDNLVPKIADFGISRRFSENKSRTITENIVGSRGYMAPEFSTNGIITLKIDIYSLGVIIMDILMGYREYHPNVDEVRQCWANSFQTTESHVLLEQVKVCAEIGINCMHNDPSQRPAIEDIICRLVETDISYSCSIVRSVASTSSPSAGQLQVHPLELCFPLEAKKRIPCLLNFINRTDGFANYWIIPQLPEIYSIDELSLVLGPMSTGTLKVTMVEQEQPPLDLGIFKILMITMGSEGELKDLVSSIGNQQNFDGGFLKLVEELGEEVHSAIVTAVVDYQPRERSSAPKIVSSVAFTSMGYVDVHPTKPWILAGGDNYLTIWDHNEEVTVYAFDVGEEESTVPKLGIVAVIFIPRKQWFVTADLAGYVHVYSCETWQEIKKFRASNCPVMSLAIHPTYPYLLLAGFDGVLMLWNWDKGWTCSRKVRSSSDSSIPSYFIAKFNPNNTETFTCGDKLYGLKVWSIDGPNKPIITIQQNYEHMLYDHVFTEASQNHVVVDKDGLTIWDLQTGTLVHTLYETAKYFNTAVACHPTLPLIVAGIYSNAFPHPYRPLVRFWNSTNYSVGARIYALAPNNSKKQTPMGISIKPPKTITFYAIVWNFYVPNQRQGETYCSFSMLRAMPPYWFLNQLKKDTSNGTDGVRYIYRIEKTVSCTCFNWIRYLGFVGSRRLVIGTHENLEIEVLEIDMESLVRQQ